MRVVGWLVALLVLLPVTAGAQVVFAVPPAADSYGYCAGCGADAGLNAAAECSAAGGGGCAPVLDCGPGWAAVAFSTDDNHKGLGLACELADENQAVAVAVLACAQAVNGFCRPDISIAPDGSVNQPVADFTPAAFLLQLILDSAGEDPGPADGRDSPQTQAALRAFQHRLGLIENGEVTPQNAWKAIMAFGGQQAMLDMMAQAVTAPLRAERPDAIFAASANPLPRRPLAEELLAYGEAERLFALSLFLRGQGHPCSETALSAVTPFEGDIVYWNVGCTEADYDLFLQPDGSSIINATPKP